MEYIYLFELLWCYLFNTGVLYTNKPYVMPLENVLNPKNDAIKFEILQKLDVCLLSLRVVGGSGWGEIQDDWFDCSSK